MYYCPAPKQVAIGLFEIIEGPDILIGDWTENLHFRIKPIFPVEEEKSVSYYDLVENLAFFKDEEGIPYKGRQAAVRLQGTVKGISEDDFNIICNLYNKKENDTIKPTNDKTSLHIGMIKYSHLQANQFQSYSFIGVQERNRVLRAVTEEEENESNPGELPSWIIDIAKQLKTFNRLKFIDNIWFFEESPGFFIPFAAFEHEKDNDLRGVMDRFAALDNTLKSNVHLKEIEPLYFLISKDSQQAESYERKISEHGEWRQFSISHKFYIYSIKQLEYREPGFVQLITENLLTVYRPKL